MHIDEDIAHDTPLASVEHDRGRREQSNPLKDPPLFVF